MCWRDHPDPRQRPGTRHASRVTRSNATRTRRHNAPAPVDQRRAARVGEASLSGVARQIASRYGPPVASALVVAIAGLAGWWLMARYGMRQRGNQSLAFLAVTAGALCGALLVTAWTARRRGLADIAAAWQRVGHVEAARAELERLIAGMPVAVHQGEITPDGTYVRRYLTSGIERMTGWTVAQIPDYQAWLSLAHDADRATAATHYRDVARDGAANTEYRLRRPDGTIAWVRQQSRVVTARDGTREVVGILSDVTAEHALLERIVSSEARLRGFLNASPDAMIIADESGEIVMANQRVEALFGHHADSIVGKPLRVLVPERHRIEHADLERSFFAAPRTRPLSTSRSLTGLRADGVEFPVEISLSPYRAADGLFVIAVVRDITERLRAEEQLRQSRKMEAVGQLTGGIAHDFNNLLTSIIGNTELLEWDDKTYDAETTALIAAIRRSSERAALLTRQLLAFSRKQPLHPAVTDVNALIGAMSDLLRRTIGENIVIDEALGEALWPVRTDGNQFENALLNVAINARDAMPNGGRLTIQTANVRLDQHYADTAPEVTPGDYVMTAVSDTGAGMNEETLRQAFEPFFTTKASGLGTGLGLSQVYGFVKQSGGHIRLYSELGTGSTVRIYLPRHLDGETTDARPPEPPVPMPLHGTETVLVVEDDATVREFAHDALTFLGYRVLTADSAASAMMTMTEHSDIALLFTDIGMPRTSGVQLAEDAARLRPRLKILFTTGYGPAAIDNDRAATAGIELLPKPYTIESLAKLVRATLDNVPADERRSDIL